MSSDAPDLGGADPSRPRRRFWLVAALVLLAVLGVGALAIDRRGARMLPPPSSATERAPSPSPALPSSALNVEVRYDLGPVREALEQRVPRRFGDLDEARVHPDNPALSYAVALEREPLELALRGDTAHLTAVVHYQARIELDSPFGGEIRASCVEDGASGRSGDSADSGDPARRPRAVVRLSSPLELGSDWRISSNLRVEEVRPASGSARDRCEVALGPLRIDVTEALLAAAEERVREAVAELDPAVRALDLRSVVEPLWARLQEPMPLDDGVWLRVEPDSVRLGSVEGRGPEGGTLSALLAVVARPRIVVGSRPESGGAPLPPLAEGPVDERSTALVDAHIDYRTASRRATEALRGREVTFAGRAVRVDGVEVSAAGDGRIAVEVDVDGAVGGRLRLVGSPAFDPSTGEVTVPDLGFSVERGDALLRGAAWLIRGTVPNRVRRAVRWNTREVVAGARSLVDDELDRTLADGVRLNGSVDRIEVLDVHGTEQGILVRVRLEGALRLRVGPAAGAPRPATDGAAPGPR